MQIFTSAPGKLVILGEYAVLHGAPALVMAVNRRAEVRITSTTDGRCAIESLGAQLERASFQWVGDPGWHDTVTPLPESMSLVTEIIRFALGKTGDSLHRQLPAFHARLDTRAFFRTSDAGCSKLGLGSSAALTVALASALALFAGAGASLSDRHAWLARLRAMHQNFQGGSGSGADLAASLFGNVIRYSLDASGGAADVRPSRLPKGIETAFIWSGRSASTSAFLQRLQSWRSGHGVRYHALMQEMAALAHSGIVAAEEDNAAAFMDVGRRYGDAMKTLGAESTLDIFSSEHRHLEKLVAPLGVVYKPCGAGGGDIGMAITADPEIMPRLLALIAAAGYELVPLQPDKIGLKTEISTE